MLEACTLTALSPNLRQTDSFAALEDERDAMPTIAGAAGANILQLVTDAIISVYVTLSKQQTTHEI